MLNLLNLLSLLKLLRLLIWQNLQVWLTFLPAPPGHGRRRRGRRRRRRRGRLNLRVLLHARAHHRLGGAPRLAQALQRQRAAVLDARPARAYGRADIAINTSRDAIQVKTRGLKARVDDAAGNICSSHVIGYRFTQETRQQNGLAGVVGNIWLSHVVVTRFNSRNEGSTCVSMTWRETCRGDIARHVIGCYLSQDTRVQNACRLRGWQYLMTWVVRAIFDCPCRAMQCGGGTRRTWRRWDARASTRRALGPGRYRSPRHKMLPFNTILVGQEGILLSTRNEGSKCLSMTWRATSALGPGQCCSPRHMIPIKSRIEV